MLDEVKLACQRALTAAHVYRPRKTADPVQSAQSCCLMSATGHRPPQRHEDVGASVERSHQHGKLVGLRAAVGEVGHFEVPGHLGNQLLSILVHRGV